MQPFSAEPAPGPANAAQRKAVHDLRNLFAIICAAKALLERHSSPERQEELLAAIGEATRQGGQLTTNMLASGTDEPPRVNFDVRERLTRLAPMLRVLADIEINLAPTCKTQRLPLRLVAADFDAAVLELVSNAAAAGASTVTIRARRSGHKIWLLISDNGCGMSEATLQRARRGRDLGLAHGTGLSRVQQFVVANGGDVLIKSRQSVGTTFALIFETDKPGEASRSSQANLLETQETIRCANPTSSCSVTSLPNSHGNRGWILPTSALPFITAS